MVGGHIEAEDLDAAARCNSSKCSKCREPCDNHACTLCLLTWHPACALSMVQHINKQELDVLSADYAKALRDLPPWMQVFIMDMAASSSSSSNSRDRPDTALGHES